MHFIGLVLYIIALWLLTTAETVTIERSTRHLRGDYRSSRSKELLPIFGFT